LRQARLSARDPTSFVLAVFTLRAGAAQVGRQSEASYRSWAQRPYPARFDPTIARGECMQAMRKLPVVPVCRSGPILIYRNKLDAAPKSRHDPRRPVLAMRGASRSSRTLGAGCDGRVGSQRANSARTNDLDADGEVVWSWSPDAETKLRGTIRAMTGARKPGPRGEREGHR
jgi:hypothetical protein